MPADIILLDKEIFKETKAKVRYSYNYCTLSYSMAFWGENEWQEELDWLALNGVNVVLDATAQEEVWRRFLTNIGYTHEEILKFITGPAYYAWAYMANMSGFGGPVHDSWFIERTELARKNHLKMRKLGMYPVLQGYSGMLPNNITDHFGDIDVIMQGTWCSFDRPIMLRTTASIFREFAERFYKAQSEVYGDYSIYYATDPFHEGGNTSDMLPREISREVLSAMLDFDSDAVWIIQSWQTNPTSELLAGLDLVENGKQHALILDLYAEKMPNYKNGHSENPAHGYSKEFDKTPWVFCMLNNFGGRLGLHGHLDNLANWIPEAYNNCDYIAGIGITPEASFNNPVLYDFLFESVWRDSFDGEIKPINLNEWICDYAERRYGGKSDNANKAWEILLNTVYKAELNNFNTKYYQEFVSLYPVLTSGSEFNPINGIAIHELYTEVNEKIQKYGYTGIFVVYDEFSKFLSGNLKNTDTDEIEVLQYFAEACSRSGKKQMHIMLISHQSILNYVDKLSKAKINSWKAVSQRYKSVELNTSAAQMYDLTAHVIKKEPVWYDEFLCNHAVAFEKVYNKWKDKSNATEPTRFVINISGFEI
jgi:hypothetical protein